MEGGEKRLPAIAKAVKTTLISCTSLTSRKRSTSRSKGIESKNSHPISIYRLWQASINWLHTAPITDYVSGRTAFQNKQWLPAELFVPPTPLRPRTLFRPSPSLSRVWIQDGARLIKICARAESSYETFPFHLHVHFHNSQMAYT